MHTAEQVNTLAAQFAALMMNALGREKIAEVNRRNANAEVGVCHSHDFIDANEVMEQAFHDFTGRWTRAESEEDAALCDAAWIAAKKSMFAEAGFK